ncbi:hypothetical protein AMECASPLE_013982 [Ameca splendens]|uniref:Metalloendopeptidase n=1 Tax=Ameca splendens TaxID=208324 RepID=A0ABV0XEL7_9TELE
MATAGPRSRKQEEIAPSVVSAVNVTHPAMNQTESTASNHTLSPNKSAETIEVRNMTLEEGDILLAEDRNAVNMVWSDAIVPYEISPGVGFRAADILAAFRMISANTCIRFVEHTDEFNYLVFKQGEGCASFVGVSGGSQPVFLSLACTVGNLAHELIHALGLYHEHTRDDRDNYVTINWSNIISSKKDNFKVKRGNTLNLPYDFESIMHYGESYFSVDGSPTIVTNQNGKAIELSFVQSCPTSLSILKTATVIKSAVLALMTDIVQTTDASFCV